MAMGTDDREATQLRIATEFQQNLYETFNEWHPFERNECHFLKDFIGYVLVGPPNYIELENGDFSYDPKQCEMINLVFDKVVEYGRNAQSDGTVLCGVMYNVIYNKAQSLNAKKDKKNENKEADKKSKNRVEKMKAIEPAAEVYPVPVFKVRSYRSVEKEKEKNAAAKPNAVKTYYIDNGGRVYDGFLDYLQNNTLPECTMVVPKDGRYQADPVSSCLDKSVSRVWIDVHQSPASNVASTVLWGADIASAVVSLASMSVGIAAMVTPLGVGIAAAGAVAAGLSSLWPIGRGAQQLADRDQHGESINVTNRVALGAWIGVASGTLGMATGGGTMLLSQAVRTVTTVGAAAKVAHGSVLIGNLIVNGIDVAYKSENKIGDFQKILCDLPDAKIATEIYSKLIEIAKKIRDTMLPKKLGIGNILSKIVQFLWDEIERKLLGKKSNDPSGRRRLDEFIDELWDLVKKKAEVLVQAFREWLENEFP